LFECDQSRRPLAYWVVLQLATLANCAVFTDLKIQLAIIVLAYPKKKKIIECSGVKLISQFTVRQYDRSINGYGYSRFRVLYPYPNLDMDMDMDYPYPLESPTEDIKLCHCPSSQVLP